MYLCFLYTLQLGYLGDSKSRFVIRLLKIWLEETFEILLSTIPPDSFLQEYYMNEILIFLAVSRVFCHTFVTLWQSSCHMEPVESA